jgi:NTP-dependent ternary conflict system VMAP-like protein
LLRGVIFPDLVELYRQVAGPGAPDLPVHTTYREIFYTLETLNAEPDGLPKPIVFVEHLASGRRSELSMELRRWSDRQASRLGVIAELQKMRREFRPSGPVPAPNLPAYLVLLIQRVGGTANRLQLSHWRQLDVSEGWHPDRGKDFTGTLEEIKRHVAALIESAEIDWARARPDIRIEFVLPADLLNLDVDQWPWEYDTPLPPVPLGCRYTVTIRSLERMTTGRWHRVWHSRWGVLTDQLEIGSIDPGSTLRAESGYSIRKLVADFENNSNLVTMVLSKPPVPAQNGGDEIDVGLRAGIPVIIWSREDCETEDFLIAVAELLHGDTPANILQRVKLLRTTAYQSQADHVGHHLAVLFDDPERLIDPGPQFI